MNEKRKAYYKRVRDRIEAEKHNICVSFLNLPEANSNYFAYRYAIKEKIEAVQRYMGLQTQFSFERDVNMIFPVKGKMLLFFKSEIQKIFFLNRYHKISLQIPPYRSLPLESPTFSEGSVRKSCDSPLYREQLKIRQRCFMRNRVI